MVTGVEPESPVNVGGYSDRSTLLGGNTPKITTQYPGSAFSTFDFQKFSYGCVLATAEDVLSAPISCSVTASGYKNAQKVTDQTFNFLVDGLVEDMNTATLNDQFKGVDTVVMASETFQTYSSMLVS